MGDLTGKSVLVTGAGGFIGTHLVKRLLTEGANVFALDRKPTQNMPISYFNADLCDTNFLNNVIMQINPQIIVHLAACMDKAASEKEVMAVNYQGTINLLNALESVQYERFIYISTSELYFGNKTPFTEQMAITPKTAYARSKAKAEEYCLVQFNEKRKPIALIRPAIVYGPGQAGSMFIPKCIDSALKGQEIKMTAGEQTRDFVYIDDVVEAIISASHAPAVAGGIINLGSGIETTLKYAALKINELAGNAASINFGALPYRENELWHYVLDITKAKQVMGWVPMVSLEEGLKKTIDSCKF